MRRRRYGKRNYLLFDLLPIWVCRVGWELKSAMASNWNGTLFQIWHRLLRNHDFCSPRSWEMVFMGSDCFLVRFEVFSSGYDTRFQVQFERLRKIEESTIWFLFRPLQVEFHLPPSLKVRETLEVDVKIGNNINSCMDVSNQIKIFISLSYSFTQFIRKSSLDEQKLVAHKSFQFVNWLY